MTPFPAVSPDDDAPPRSRPQTRLVRLDHVIAVIPYHLGFTPHRSLVVLAVCGTTLVATARIDLTAVDSPDHGVENLLVTLTDRTVDLVDQQGRLALVVIGYEDEPGDAVPAVIESGRRAEWRGTPVMCAAVVRGDLWWDLRDPLCPDEGRRLPAPADVPAVADFVIRGIAPLDSRDQLVAMLEPDTSAEVAALLPAASFLPDPGRSSTGARAGVRRVRLRQAGAWGRLLAPERIAEPIDPALAAPDIADALISLRDVPFRDALIAWLAPGALAQREADGRIIAMLRANVPSMGGIGDEFAPVQARLAQLARVAPRDQVAPVLTVLSVCAWQARHGAMASIAIERALAYEPEYRLAVLMAQLLRHGVRPDHRSA